MADFSHTPPSPGAGHDAPDDAPVAALVREMLTREAGGPAPASQGADQRSVREFNRLLVVRFLRTQGPTARVALADRTGLSRTTVGSIIDDLLRDRLVREGDALDASPTGGRRATLLHFNDDSAYVLGIDLGRSHLTLILATLAARVVARESGPMATGRGPAVCIPEVAARVRAFVAGCGVPWGALAGAGMGVPGTMDAEHQRLVHPPRMPGWDGADIREMLARDLDLPVFLDNDANMGALGEARHGAGRGVGVLAYVKLGTGIGGGLVIGQRVFRGQGGSAGEIGHLSIAEDGPPCDCGNHGCLEAFAGADAIVADARAGVPWADGALDDESPALASCPDADVADVIGAARAGDRASIAALGRAGERVGLALAGLINLFNPSVVLLDGGVARAGDFLLDPLRRTAAERSLPAAWQRVAIRLGALGENAIALGAATAVAEAAFGGPIPFEPGFVPAADAAAVSAATFPAAVAHGSPVV